MTKKIKILLCAALSFAFCFMTVGFSAITGTLSISGSAELEIPEGLFITEISVVSTTNLDSQSASFVPYSTAVDVTLNRRSSYFNNSAGSVTYEITVFNNTSQTYAYREIYYQTNLNGYNGNSSIRMSNSNNAIGVVCSLENESVAKKTVPPKGRLTFEVTYTVGKNMRDVDYKTLVNYQFGINVESEEAAKEAVNEKFLDILNTSTTYESLVDNLDNKFDGAQEWTSNYIGNVIEGSDDAIAVNALFAGQLHIVIDGVTKPASVIIKHENVDGNTMTGDDYTAVNESNGGVFNGYGCEMTLYMTTDALNTAYGTATVYVSVYTCDRDENGNIVGDWYRIGDTYKGTANIVGYNGESGGTGSFVTDNWVSTAATYVPTSSYSYYVSSGVTIKSLTQVVDANAIAELQRLLNKAKAMIDDKTYAGIGITMVEDAYAAAAPYYQLDENGNPVANNDTTRAKLCPIISGLDYTLTEAQKAIDELLGAS